jgi:hypothetical protein
MRWHHWGLIYLAVGAGVAIYDQMGASPKSIGTYAFDTVLWPVSVYQILTNKGSSS